MTEAAALELRHVRLAEPVTLRPAPLGDGEDGVFVALDDSPPVRTVLAVVEGGRRRALEVAWVVEVAERDEARGFYGRWVADEALERAARVGTEHLEDGMPVVQPVVHDNSSVLDVSDTAMAMPAPVIVLDDDNGEDEEDDEDGEAREASAEAGEAHEGEERSDADASAAEASDGPVQADTAEHAETVGPADNVYTAETVSYPEHAVEQHAVEQAQPDEAAGSEATSDATEAGAESPDTLHYAEYRNPEGTASEGAEQAANDEPAEATHAGDAGADADEAAEAGTDGGEAPEAPSESGDPGESRSKGRKKRGRRRR